MSAADAPLFDALRALRAQLAREQNVPAYVIFHDATLREIATRRPHDLDALGQVNGVGSSQARALRRELAGGVARGLTQPEPVRYSDWPSSMNTTRSPPSRKPAPKISGPTQESKPMNTLPFRMPSSISMLSRRSQALPYSSVPPTCAERLSTLPSS